MSVAEGSVTPLEYHHATKHTFTRFARSAGYLDWATQPSPFRRYAGTGILPLARDAAVARSAYDTLYSGAAASMPLSLATLGEFLRCSLGLSAWKSYGSARWPLRVNPSSGNLHPTEGYVLWERSLFHYAPAEHVLEERAAFTSKLPESGSSFLVALTSIHWREAWKYGERAFRYCQHDVGHALGSLRLAAAMLGWRMTLLADWSHASLAAVLGLDRAEDFADAEREDPDLVALVSCDGTVDRTPFDSESFVEAARAAVWAGRASRLSVRHVEWPLIDQVTQGTVYPGIDTTSGAAIVPQGGDSPGEPLARSIILQRRSATSFNGRGVLQRKAFMSMLQRLNPPRPPWDVAWWPPHVHLALFVHRVQDLPAGIYAYLRADDGSEQEWRATMRPEFLWEPVESERGKVAGLFLLIPIDARQTASRISCDQDIASDGFFSLGMIARMAGLRTYGSWFYRHLFWECGLIGQVLYLEAEAVGARSTGIGCYYDDPVHDVLGLQGDGDWQSLYHFSMGLPVDDPRLTTEPGYDWER